MEPISGTVERSTIFQKKIDSFEYKMSLVEKKLLNPIGHVPFVSLPSAVARAGISWIQGISFLSLAGYYALEGKGGNEGKILNEKTWRCLNQVAHAFLNHGRAIVEAVPILGNLVTMIYDFVLKERFKYQEEKEYNLVATFLAFQTFPQEFNTLFFNKLGLTTPSKESEEKET